jgi:hypothetical protein
VDLERLAQVVAQAQRRKGLSDYALEHELGRPGGKAFNAKQFARWKAGKRKQPIPRPVVLKLIEILELPGDETAELAGIWPPRRTAAMLKVLDAEIAATTDKVLPGYHGVALPGLLDLDPDLIRRTRVERRRRDRRRRRPWIVPIELEKVAA